ncbi:MAG: hypothetical protein IKS26_02075, partial [Paludibacteraceae bacterium]|nr:hypothetical protein [Paludibacteraceae bacterium]
VSFYIQWALKKMVPPCESANAAALYRFLTDDCHLKTDTEPKGVINNIRDMIKARIIDENHNGEIAEIFSSVNVEPDSVN